VLDQGGTWATMACLWAREPKGGPRGDQNIDSTIKGHGRRNWAIRLLTWSRPGPDCMGTTWCAHGCMGTWDDYRGPGGDPMDGRQGYRPGCVSTRELLGRTNERDNRKRSKRSGVGQPFTRSAPSEWMVERQRRGLKWLVRIGMHVTGPLGLSPRLARLLAPL